MSRHRKLVESWGSFFACEHCGASAGAPCRDTFLRLGFGPWLKQKFAHKGRERVGRTP